MKPIDEGGAFLPADRSKSEMRKLMRQLLLDWDITGYFVAIHDMGPGPAAIIYPDNHIVTVADSMLNWSTPAVMGMAFHEIGHLVLGHYLGEHHNSLDNYLDEYEADEFAFDAIQTLYRYMPTSAGLWMLDTCGTWRWDNDCFTHPSCQHRWERLAFNGYLPANHRPTYRALGLVKPKEYI